ncbi:hydroxymethylbilane synthase [Fulvivirga sedimenti]|uniref:Hydroxymethylbilane synthase n=1 Tax=Fulvivirga sedimenti TaxID=2879465 RepID=A0A9X1HX35_9BACT|nr:hydroxymethylbilane synthase [Fulvivirga sedimenti]MCA6078022.1 hydroxymethylbilane synthase [Fulvivirga sedimenti]
MHIRIATRGSKLALWQAHHIAALLKDAGISTEIVTMETTGDKILDVTIAKIGSKGVFTEELEAALKNGKAEIAVHSAKDMPSELPAGFELIAFTRREKENDVLISEKDGVSMNSEITVGTSSTRRTALIKHYYPHCRIIPVRGNLQTRIRKMQEGLCDALLLAYAGIHRMEYDHLIKAHLAMDQFTPPVGQGSVTVEIHEGLPVEIKNAVRAAVNDTQTEYCLRAERAFLKKLEGGCSIPSFGYARWINEEIHMDAGLVSLDGKQLIRTSGKAAGAEAHQLGFRLATEVLEAGGDKILKDIKTNQL